MAPRVCGRGPEEPGGRACRRSPPGACRRSPPEAWRGPPGGLEGRWDAGQGLLPPAGTEQALPGGAWALPAWRPRLLQASELPQAWEPVQRAWLEERWGGARGLMRLAGPQKEQRGETQGRPAAALGLRAWPRLPLAWPAPQGPEVWQGPGAWTWRGRWPRAWPVLRVRPEHWERTVRLEWLPSSPSESICQRLQLARQPMERPRQFRFRSSARCGCERLRRH